MMQRGKLWGTKDILFYCENCPEFTWDAAMDELKIAAEDWTFTDEPQSASQLLVCGDTMRRTNVLPLKTLLAAVDSEVDESDEESDEDDVEDDDDDDDDSETPEYSRFKHRAIVECTLPARHGCVSEVNPAVCNCEHDRVFAVG